jgi:hypothetical protein
MGGVQSKKEKKLNGYQHSDGIKQKLSNASNKSSISDKKSPSIALAKLYQFLLIPWHLHTAQASSVLCIVLKLYLNRRVS